MACFVSDKIISEPTKKQESILTSCFFAYNFHLAKMFLIVSIQKHLSKNAAKPSFFYILHQPSQTGVFHDPKEVFFWQAKKALPVRDTRHRVSTSIWSSARSCVSNTDVFSPGNPCAHRVCTQSALQRTNRTLVRINRSDHLLSKQF